MNRAEQPGPGDRAPGDRLSRLSQAMLRINESLDFDTVLQEVVDSARTLTGSRYGAITVPGESGQPPDFIVSGLTREEHRGLWEMPQGLGFFEYLSGVETPLRVSDIAGHLRALGMPGFSPPVPASSLLVAPMRQQGSGVGTIYLAHEAEGREFSQEDEDTLAMFAAQAALVIANARRHREEQRAKARLETLVNTSPVGVVVFDAGTGAPSFINREALRIVERLSDPDQRPERLLEVLTFRRADGREVSLREYPLAAALSSGETVRAEEIEMQVPDGRRVSVIINSTPILAEEGGIGSVVVTLQDLPPMRELGRQRAEFLSMVSQELLAPLTSIRGSATAVLKDLARLDLDKARQFFSLIEWQADRMQGLLWDLLELARIEAGTMPLTPEPTDLAFLVGQAQASFREGESGNTVEVEVDLSPDLPQVSADRQRTLQVLDRLLSDASGYSREGSAITVSARREDSHVAVCVARRDQDTPSRPQPLLFRRRSPMGGGGESVSGGEALGLAVCRGIVEAHGGRIWVENDGLGLGSRCIFTLPVAEGAAPRRAGAAGLSSAAAGRAARGLGRVLVVEDDPQALWHIRNTLTEAGYTPVATWDPEEVERLIATERPHLVLLDSALAGADGSGLMQRISKATDAPVVLLSGRGAAPERELALAFESGAEDYIASPFASTELVARLGAALRRRDAPERAPDQGSFHLGELAVDYARRRVTVGGRAVEMTDTEYRLLCELAVNAGRTLTREHLMHRVWSAREPGDSSMLRGYVRRLREKLGESAENPRYIFNEPRAGYRLGEAGEPAGGQE